MQTLLSTTYSNFKTKRSDLLFPENSRLQTCTCEERLNSLTNECKSLVLSNTDMLIEAGGHVCQVKALIDWSAPMISRLNDKKTWKELPAELMVIKSAIISKYFNVAPHISQQHPYYKRCCPTKYFPITPSNLKVNVLVLSGLIELKVFYWVRCCQIFLTDAFRCIWLCC